MSTTEPISTPLNFTGAPTLSPSTAPGKEADELRRVLEQLPGAEHHHADHRQGDGADDERADQRGIGFPTHWPSLRAVFLPRGSGNGARSRCPSAAAPSAGRRRSWSASPRRGTRCWCAIAKMLASSCVTTTMVAPRLSRSSRIRSSSSFELIGSSPADGSSKKSTSGSSAMARARPARFCMPPLICDGIEVFEALQPDQRQLEAGDLADLGRASGRCTRRAAGRCSRPASSSSTARRSGRARRSAAASAAASPASAAVKFSLPYQISPLAGSFRPIRWRSNVLLPQPLPPMMMKTSPRFTVKLRSRISTKLP